MQTPSRSTLFAVYLFLTNSCSLFHKRILEFLASYAPACAFAEIRFDLLLDPVGRPNYVMRTEHFTGYHCLRQSVLIWSILQTKVGTQRIAFAEKYRKPVKTLKR